MPSATSTARLEARISTELHVIKEGEVVRLSLADSERFAQALLSPPDPSPALERAFAWRRKLLRPTSKAQVKTLAPRDPRAPKAGRSEDRKFNGSLESIAGGGSRGQSRISC